MSEVATGDLRALRTPFTVGVLCISDAVLLALALNDVSPLTLISDLPSAASGWLVGLLGAPIALTLVLLAGSVWQALSRRPAEFLSQFRVTRPPWIGSSRTRASDESPSEALADVYFDTSLAEELDGMRRERAPRRGLDFDRHLIHLAAVQPARAAQAQRHRAEAEFSGAIAVPFGLFVVAVAWSFGSIRGTWALLALSLFAGAMVAYALYRDCVSKLENVDLLVDYWVRAKLGQARRVS